MKAYLTLLGRSKWALINSYYATLEEKSYYADKVTIYAEVNSEPQEMRAYMKSYLAVTSHFSPLPP